MSHRILFSVNSVLLGNTHVKDGVVSSVWQIVGEIVDLAGTKEEFITKITNMNVPVLVIVLLYLRR